MPYTEYEARQIVDEYLAVKASLGQVVPWQRYGEFVRAILTEEDSDEL